MLSPGVHPCAPSPSFLPAKQDAPESDPGTAHKVARLSRIHRFLSTIVRCRALSLLVPTTLCWFYSCAFSMYISPTSPSLPTPSLLRPPDLSLDHDGQDQEGKVCRDLSPPNLCQEPRPRNPYIDDRADVKDESMQEDGPEDDNDNIDAEVRRADAAAFAMPAILAGHEERLRSDAPSRVPSELLLPPISALLQPAQTAQSPARAPSFFAGPASFEQARDRTPLFLPDSRGPTPFTYRTPTPFSREPRAFPQAAPYQSNPLFLPDSRGPTPFTYRTPTPFTREPTAFPQAAPRQSTSGPRQSTGARAPSRSPSRSPSPPRKRRRRDGATTFFDLEASDSDSDDDEEDDVLVMTQQDLDFIDNAPLPHEELAEHYDQQAASYLQDMEAEEQHLVPLSDTAQDLARDPELRRAIEQAVLETMPKPAPTLPPHENESAARTAFRLKQLLPAVSKDAVEIGTWIRFRESRKSKPVLAFTVANNQVLLERETVRFPCPLLKARNPCVFPTMEEVAPFLGAFHEFREVMTAARFIGPAFALQPGDRAIVLPPAGTLAGADVWITQIQDFVHEGSDRYTRLKGADDAIVYCGDDALVKGGARGAWHPLNLLKRHVLCPSPTPRILDRVRVTGAHRGMDGGVAWIVQIQDIPEIPSGQMITLKGEDDKMFEIELSRLHREFRLGDEVVVARGDLKSRKGFVIVIHPGAVLEIFDGATCESSLIEPKESSDFLVAHTFRVWESDVDFLPFDADTNSSTMFALNTGAGQYTVRSEVSHPSVPLPALPAPSVPLTNEEDENAYFAEYDARNAATATIASWDFKKLHTLVSKLKQLDQERTELTERVARRFEGLEVLVVGAQGTYRRIDAYKASVFKGKRGTVIADFDSKERAERLKQQDLKLRKNIRGDTRGIMATVRETSGAQFQVGIEKLVHAAYVFFFLSGSGLLTRSYQDAPAASPSPLLAQLVAQADSEDSLSPWQWLVPGPSTRPGTPVPQLQPGASDEAFGGLGGILAHTLVGEDTGAWLCTAAVVHKRVDVLIKGVAGWAGTKEMSSSAKLQCVEGKHGVVLLSELFPESHLKRTKFKVVPVAQRVLVLGGDIENDKSKVGEYAETQPHIQHSHRDKVVAVRFELGSSGFYHELALCRSTNKAIDSPEHSFPTTSFN
ncbi:hypothetical protein B0H17DRAFT_1217642 [Mycena rosella]|uniref:Uncharacterized protein n=1 Tax=Mycena rosella TaxID=1033263 RepID=A0AAD7BVQ2_MYCRO|nr:hypothetical protein B0H17DRAFT_1217642 [Mycena rosella]